MRALLAVAAIVLAVAACGAFGTGDSDTSTATDAGSSSGSSSTGGVAEGGSSSGGGEPDGSAPEDFCAGRTHVFCTGFDVMGSPFGFTSSTNPFAYSFGDSFVSPPHSLHLSADMGDGADKFLTWASTDPGTKPSTIKVQFQMRVESSAGSSSSSDARLVEIACADGNYVRLKLKPSGALQVGGKDRENVVTAAPAKAQTWGDVTFVWSLQGEQVSLATSLAESENATAPSSCRAPFTVALGFGNWQDPPKGAYSVSFDDFEIVLN